MKEFRVYLWVLFSSLIVFMMSLYFMMCSSLWFVILLFLSLIWVMEMIIFTVKFLRSDVLEPRERKKIFRILNISTLIFLVASLANGIVSLSLSGIITATIGLFLFICFVLSIFFSLIVKKWLKKRVSIVFGWDFFLIYALYSPITSLKFLFQKHAYFFWNLVRTAQFTDFS